MPPPQYSFDIFSVFFPKAGKTGIEYRGTIAIQPTVSVVTDTLSPGWQQGLITFTASSSDVLVPVSAYYGTVSRIYLPTVPQTYP